MDGENTTPTPAQPGTTPQTPAHHNHHTMTLFHHQPHQHQPRNVNALHEAEKAAGGFNQKVAVGMTGVFQAMPTFWVIIIWITLSSDLFTTAAFVLLVCNFHFPYMQFLSLLV